MGIGVKMATLKELLGDAYKDGMSVEEVENALSTKKIVDISTGAYVSISKYQALENERNDFKEKYNSTLTEQQRAEQEALETKRRYEAIEKENTLYKYKQKLSKTIKDEALLEEIATLYADGNVEGAFEKQNEYFEKSNAELEKKIKDDLMKQNPQGNPQGEDSATITKEQFSAMGVAERTKLFKENPDLYNELKQTT
jgi:hypothetical protein